jgi:hypothetical protein
MEMKVKIVTLASPAQVQQAALEYESEIRPPTGMWQTDPQFTYLTPISRFDGLTVNRKAGIRVEQTVFGYAPQEYTFETLATRGQVLIGSSVTNHDATQQTILEEMQCAAGAVLPDCPRLISDRREWARMVLAVHMTTFPIG